MARSQAEKFPKTCSACRRVLPVQQRSGGANMPNHTSDASVLTITGVSSSASWQEAVQQEQRSQEDQTVVHFKETVPSPHMDNFVPIDLDEWWAQRFLANIDKLS
ncbi:hypothetical protein JOB18_007116 [Solea senegalensis]|uniref:MAPK regulated corepressor interacting protein 2 n=1 Tax=Solea senegalensis TaxID=28829 RepID=A0AAV6RK59_SOLSE|nr:hypothetical protein JOB18_007116 [Solea senegalensis]